MTWGMGFNPHDLYVGVYWKRDTTMRVWIVILGFYLYLAWWCYDKSSTR